MRHFISFNYGGGKKVSGRAGWRDRAPASLPKPASRDEQLSELASRGDESGRQQGTPRSRTSGEFASAGVRRGRSSSGLGGRPGLQVCRSSSSVDGAVQGPNLPSDMGGVEGNVGEQSVLLKFSNDIDADCTVLNICGRNDTSMLMQATALLEIKGIVVSGANLNAKEEGVVCNVFRITDRDGGKIDESRWPELEADLLKLLGTSSRSLKPAIHGDIQLDDTSSIVRESDIVALESAAAEMARAAAELVGIERGIILEAASATAGESSIEAIERMQIERAEANSRLERKISALEAILTTRRALIERSIEEMKKEAIPDFLMPPPISTTGPAAGNGYEIILQGFNWESCNKEWYKELIAMAPEFAAAGFTAVWMPPMSNSVSKQGYLPRDLYDLNSEYGTGEELKACIDTLKEHGLKPIADIVINHRCAHEKGPDGKYNKFGGRLAWDSSVICSNNAEFGGRGERKQQEDYTAAPNIDHSQEQVRKDITEWLQWLRQSIGFSGWRFDFVKGYDGKYCAEYVNSTVPELAFGEYWDTCSYQDGVLNYNQDGHRQRTIDWCDRTGGTCAAFDFTLKGILQEAVSKQEYWRLVDNQGRPSSVIGLWPSRAITFLENHDTGSTLQHWPFPWEHVSAGYCYILTHPGTPCVFFDHFYYDQTIKQDVLKLIEIRRKYGISSKSEVVVQRAYNDVYAAIVGKKVAVKIGPGDYSPNSGDSKAWEMLHSGKNFAVWGLGEK